MPQDRPTVLLTGFGPFPSVGANATSILVPRLAAAARRALPGLDVAVHILPTEWIGGLDRLEELVCDLKPVVALHFGVSGRATGFEIETRGRNLCAWSEDAAGCLPLGRCVSPDGPEFLPTTLPVAHIVERLRRRGLPVRPSRDAGGYLCNALLYRSLEISRLNGTPERCGFVHLPASLVSERRPEWEPTLGRRLGWDDVVVGGVEIIMGALGRPPVALSPLHGAALRRGTPVNGRLTLAT